jgi:hypothetical protein
MRVTPELKAHRQHFRHDARRAIPTSFIDFYSEFCILGAPDQVVARSPLGLVLNCGNTLGAAYRIGESYGVAASGAVLGIARSNTL